MGDVCFSFVVMMFYFFRWMKMNMIIFLMEAEMVEMAMLVMLVVEEMEMARLVMFVVREMLEMASTSVDGLSLRRWTVGRWSHACMGAPRSSAKKNHLKHSASLLSLRRNTCITGPASSNLMVLFSFEGLPESSSNN